MPINVAIIAPRVSDSARRLSEAIHRDASNTIHSFYRRMDAMYGRQRSVDTVINWGSSNQGVGSGSAEVTGRTVLNQPGAVNRAANKFNAFRAWAPTTIPNLEFTTSRQVAHGWLNDRSTDRVYCRTTLRGNSGDGIVVARTIGEVVQAPLYTKGVDLHHEFRFHVMGTTVFDGVRKAFRPEIPEAERNRDVMNHAAGTIFVRSGPALERASTNSQMMADCVASIAALGLDFGAVDVLVDRAGQHHIIEVNTACGLEGTTLERYTRAFTEKLSGGVVTPWNLGEFSGQPVAPTTPEILQQEIQQMNISQIAVGISITFNPAAPSSIATLTRNRPYVVTRVGREVVYVRNDRGTIQGYRPAHFQAAAATPAAPAPIVLVGPSDGSISTEAAHDSPLRVILLADGSSVNVTGQAQFVGSSRRIDTDSTVTIADMWRGVDSGDVFIGVEVEGEIYRFISTSFSSGVVNTDGTEGAMAPADQLGLRVVDSNGNLLRNNDYVVVSVGAGGHNLAVGTIGQVTAVTEARVSISVEGANGAVRLQPNRVTKITQRERDRLIAEEAALVAQQTTQFSVGTHSYRVAQRDMDELHQVLRRYTV